MRISGFVKAAMVDGSILCVGVERPTARGSDGVAATTRSDLAHAGAAEKI